MNIKKMWILLVFAFLLFGCDAGSAPTTTVAEPAEKPARTAVVMDLGEIPETRKVFFPENRVSKKIVDLTSVSLSELVSSFEQKEEEVLLTLLPIKSQMGKTLTGSDVLESIKEAYREDVYRYSANLMESSYDALEMRLVFDRDFDFEKEFMSLPIYPVTFLSGEDRDSFGDYFIVSEDPLLQKMEMYSNTLKERRELVILHSEFENAKKSYTEGLIDVLYLPRSSSSYLWADTVPGSLVKTGGDHVYMMGFGAQIPIADRFYLYRLIQPDSFIREYLGGAADVTYYPARSNIPVPGDLVFPAENENTNPEALQYKYLCFVDAEWSYRFHQYLKEILLRKGFELDTVYTDFQTMLNMALSEDSDYLFAFAWNKDAGTDLSELLGPGFSGTELDEAGETLYFQSIPVIPIATPYEQYLLVDPSFQSFVE